MSEEDELGACLKGWDDFAKKSLVDCAAFIIEEGHKLHEYQFCESSIMNSLHYLTSVRYHKKEGDENISSTS